MIFPKYPFCTLAFAGDCFILQCTESFCSMSLILLPWFCSQHFLSAEIWFNRCYFWQGHLLLKVQMSMSKPETFISTPEWVHFFLFPVPSPASLGCFFLSFFYFKAFVLFSFALSLTARESPVSLLSLPVNVSKSLLLPVPSTRCLVLISAHNRVLPFIFPFCH